MTVAVLFARQDSVYKTLNVDVYDKDRDARSFAGGKPVIAHPPCRGWGRLRHFARPEPGELLNGIWAVRQVRLYGGVLEHPAFPLLFADTGCPAPGKGYDRYGGFTFPIDQFFWGHKARKPTWLYIVGISIQDLPNFPIRLGEAEYVCGGTRSKRRPEITKAEREHTPIALATWLISLANTINAKGGINHVHAI